MLGPCGRRSHGTHPAPGSTDPVMNTTPNPAFPRRLNLGCGFDIREGYLNVDVNDFHKPDLVCDITNLRDLPANYFDEVLAQDVLEHIPRLKTQDTLAEW